MFTFTQHAYTKINGDAALAKRVFAAANFPSVTYGVTEARQRQTGHKRQERRIRDGIATVVDPVSEKIITFYVNVEETDVRPDQTDSRAQEYAAKRAAKRARREHNLAERRARDRALTLSMKGKK